MICAYILNAINYIQVREIVSILDIDVLFYPCPRNGPNFRPKVAEMGGKQQFPYMVSFLFLYIFILFFTSGGEKSLIYFNWKILKLVETKKMN